MSNHMADPTVTTLQYEPLPEPTPRKPFVGAIVHRHSVLGCQAAIVIRVRPDNGGIDINAFGPNGVEYYARLPEGTVKGSWHWPEAS